MINFTPFVQALTGGVAPTTPNEASSFSSRLPVERLKEMASNPMQDQGSRFAAAFLSSLGKAGQSRMDAQTKESLVRALGGVEQGPLTAEQAALTSLPKEALQSALADRALADPRESTMKDLQLELAQAQIAETKADTAMKGAKFGLEQSKHLLELRKLDSEIERIQSGKVFDPEKEFEATQKLRKEFLDGSKEFSKQASAAGRVFASAEDPSPAGDLALIFNYMKTLDPGSTVREGEFANAQNAGSVPTRVASLYNSVMEGTRLTAEQRKDFVSRTSKLFTQAKKQHSSLEDTYKGLANKVGLDEEQVVIDLAGGITLPDKIVATKELRGKTYVKDADGNWIEQ